MTYFSKRGKCWGCIQAHAPSPETISRVETNKATSANVVVSTGIYTDNVLGIYYDNFGGGKELKAARKKRKDAGLQKKEEDLDAPGAKKMKISERQFLRMREKESVQLEKASPASVRDMISKTGIGETVPADSGAMVTPAILQVRQKNRERIERRQAQQPDSVASSSVADGGEEIEPARTKRKTNQTIVGPSAFAPKDSVDVGVVLKRVTMDVWKRESDVRFPEDLERRDWKVVSQWPSWLKSSLERNGWKQYRSRVFVLRKWAAEIDKLPSVMVARLIGCFVTTQGEAHKSMMSKTNPAQGIWYRGFTANDMKLWISPKLASDPDLEPVVNVLKVMAEDDNCKALQIVDTLDELTDSFDAYLQSKGVRSRPTAVHCAVTRDETDRKDVQSTVKHCKGLAKTIEELVKERSIVVDQSQPLVFWSG